MSYTNAHGMVVRLFEHDPKKAQELLVRCCIENQKILDEVSFYQPRTAGRESFGSSVRPSLKEMHHPGSHGPLTPARSRSEASSSTKGDTSHKEYIYILNTVGDSIEEQLVRMKIASISNSVIRQGLVSEDDWNDNTLSTVGGQVNIPLHADTGPGRTVPYVGIVKLTWRRLKSDKTHSTEFHVVPDKNLDSDMIFSYEDASIEHPSMSLPPLDSPESRTFRGHNQERRPSGPTPHPPSYHRSDNTNITSLRALSAQHQLRHNNQQPHIPVIPEEMNFPLLASVGPMGNRYSQHMPSNATQFETSQPSQYRTAAETVTGTSSASEPQADIHPDRLRIAIKWDETRFKVWLNLEAPYQTFFESFQGEAFKCKKKWDRTTTSILLQEDEEAPDEKTYTLYLDEDDLDADWKDTVKWLRKNSKTESPHAFGTVCVDDR